MLEKLLIDLVFVLLFFMFRMLTKFLDGQWLNEHADKERLPSLIYASMVGQGIAASAAIIGIFNDLYVWSGK